MDLDDENFDDLMDPQSDDGMIDPEALAMMGQNGSTEESFPDTEASFSPETNAPQGQADMDEFEGRELPPDAYPDAEEVDTHKEDSQDSVIDSTAPSQKVPPSQNAARKLNRNRLLIVTASLVVSFIIVFMFVAPQIKMSNKKESEQEFEKASDTSIPRDILDGLDSEMEEPYQEVEDKFGPPGSASAAAATSTPSQRQEKEQKEQKPQYQNPPASSGSAGSAQSVPGGTYSEIPSNRSDQQKPFTDVTFTEHINPLTTRQQNEPSQGSGFADQFGRSAQSYTPTSLNDSINSYLATLGGSNYAAQNSQQSKQDFWKNSGGATKWQWNSNYSLWKGSVIPAVLETGINTDLPGPVTAIVTENVYSSQDATYLLIPQGSKLYANYDSSISFGQTRVQVAWNTLIRPDGLEINLGAVEGVDSSGYAGYTGSVSNHPFAYAKALGLIAMFSIIDTKVSNTQAAQTNMYAQNVLADTYKETQDLTKQILEKVVDVQPTIKVQPGSQVTLITNITMDLPPVEKPGEPEKYIRKY